MFITPLQMGELQIGQFLRLSPRPSRIARIARSRRPLIVSAREPARIGRASSAVSQLPSLTPDFSSAFHAPNAGRQLQAQQACIGGFVGEPPQCSESSIERSCCKPGHSKKMR